MRAAAPALLTVALLLGMDRAWADPIPGGTAELLPVLGATANVGAGRRQESQLQLGLDGAYSLKDALSIVLGGWVGFGDGYLGLDAHLDFKWRLVKLFPKAVPFFVAGLGFTAGYNPPTLYARRSDGTIDPTAPIPGSTDALYGFGGRVGGGIDYFVTPRVLAGVQLVFFIGHRFSPGEGFLGSVQVVAGVSWLL